MTRTATPEIESTIEPEKPEEFKEPEEISKSTNAETTGNTIVNIVNEDQQRKVVLDQIENWRTAWQSQDVARYLASYSFNFKPEKASTYLVWQKKRRGTLLKPSWIKLVLSDFQMDFSDNHAYVNVSFLQDYAASNYAEKSRKELTLMLQGDNWNIIRERSL